jgi:hypothetical protein
MAKRQKAQTPTVRADDIGPTSFTDEIGTTGLNQSFGYIREDFLSQLNGVEGNETWREMKDNSPVVGAMLFTIEALFRQVAPQLTEADHPRGEEARDLVLSCMADMQHTWEEFESEALSMLPYGFSLFEPVYKKREDGRIGWAKIPIRAQCTIRRWEIADNGDILGAEQQAPPNYTTQIIPEDRFVLFRTTSAKNNPQGRSILRNAFTAWYDMKHIERFEAIGIERNTAGFPMLKYPAEWSSQGATPAQKAALADAKEMVRRIRVDDQMGVCIPAVFDDKGNSLMDFSLISASGSVANADTSVVVTRKTNQILQTTMTDFMQLGHESSGSWALADSKTKTFAVAISAWLKGIAATINRVLFPRLMEANAIPLEAMPKLFYGDLETPDLPSLAEYVSKLVSLGVITPDETLERYLRKAGNLPDAEIDMD